MPISTVNNPVTRQLEFAETISAGALSSVVLLPSGGAAITAIPGAGGSMKVYKSTSPVSKIKADIADGSLSYANLNAGTQPTASRWQLWASGTSGSVTALTTEDPSKSAGYVAVVASATTQAGVVEIAA